jgi:beta-glucosidase
VPEGPWQWHGSRRRSGRPLVRIILPEQADNIESPDPFAAGASGTPPSVLPAKVEDIQMVDRDAVNSRVEQILAEMTLDEKTDMLVGVEMWHLKGVERLGVPMIRVSDCGHGVTSTGTTDTCATCFPTAVTQAATWNTDLLERMGSALGSEVRAKGNAILLGPMVNIHRMPLNGRSFECYSEDPYLTGKMAAALIRGVQARGVGACVKGCTGNNQQADQSELDVIVDERTLREIYLPNFRIPVAEARPWAIMTSYNGLNGRHSSACRHVLTDIVKNEWGFDGFIVSDWRGTHSSDVVTSGLDLEMPGPGKFMRQEDFLGALADGRLTEPDLDDRVRRLLRAIVRSGAIDGDDAGHAGELDSPAHRQVAREVAEEAIVLLKNEGDLLPLDDRVVKTIAIVGPNAIEARLGGGGSASVAPFYSVSPLAGLRDRCGDSVRVIYEEGCSFLGEMTVIYPEFLSPPGAADGERGLRAEFFNNQHLDGEPVHTMVQTHIDFAWGWAAPGDKVRRNEWSGRWRGTLTPPETGRYCLGAACRSGGLRLYVDGQLVLDRWGSPDGDQSAAGMYESICDHVEVNLTAGRSVEICIEYSKTANKSALRLEWDVPGWADPIERAARAAAEADVAIVCGGLCNSHEGGTNDRTDIDLPGRQVELIEAVAAANPNTVVALAGGTPLGVQPWIDHARAVLETWYGGQEGGNALARVVFGDVNPSGKLPDTFPVRLEDNPAWDNYPGDGTSVHYAEGIFVGYRHYDTRGIEPAFPFGFGLSYTRFNLSNLRLSSDTMAGDETVEVAVDVENIGDRPGKLVVQLYVRDLEASVPRPVRELKGFAKVDLEPGQTRAVDFTLDKSALSFFDSEQNRWRAEPGTFEIQVGTHSRDGQTCPLTYRS